MYVITKNKIINLDNIEVVSREANLLWFECNNNSYRITFKSEAQRDEAFFRIFDAIVIGKPGMSIIDFEEG